MPIRFLVIDDLADRDHDCDLLLAQNYFGDATASRYDARLPRKCCRLLGPCYALLQPEYVAVRAALPPRGGTIARVLVFFGGSDQTNETGKALEALGSITGGPCRRRGAWRQSSQPRNNPCSCRVQREDDPISQFTDAGWIDGARRSSRWRGWGHHMGALVSGHPERRCHRRPSSSALYKSPVERGLYALDWSWIDYDGGRLH